MIAIAASLALAKRFLFPPIENNRQSRDIIKSIRNSTLDQKNSTATYIILAASYIQYKAVPRIQGLRRQKN